MQRSIEVSRELRVSTAAAASVVAHATARVLGTSGTTAGDGVYRVVLHVDSRNDSVRHAAEVALTASGDVGDNTHRWVVTIGPLGATRFLPNFAGALAIGQRDARTVLALSGTYRPPLGALGAFGDGLLGHRLVRQSLERFLGEVAERIELEADRLVQATGPPMHEPELRPGCVSENWLG